MFDDATRPWPAKPSVLKFQITPVFAAAGASASQYGLALQQGECRPRVCECRDLVDRKPVLDSRGHLSRKKADRGDRAVRNRIVAVEVQGDLTVRSRVLQSDPENYAEELAGHCRRKCIRDTLVAKIRAVDELTARIERVPGAKRAEDRYLRVEKRSGRETGECESGIKGLRLGRSENDCVIRRTRGARARAFYTSGIGGKDASLFC